MRDRLRKLWIPILLGLFLSTGRAAAQIPADSIAGADSVSVADRVLADSLLQAQVPDSLLAAADTLPRRPRRKREALDAPVVYESSDSMIWSEGGYASLFGNGKVNYQNVQLTAAVIKMQMDSSLVYADGRMDSSGIVQGTPVFLDGGTPYESNHISYNFRTEKGYINEIITQQGEGYMTSAEAKKGPDGEYYIADGVYTTCDEHDDPHFNLRITRAKVRPGRDVIFGPAYLEVMGVPLPLFVPFGFFPFLEGDYASGIIVPTYGDEMERGFYLKDGGYYFALSDYFDLKVLGEIFTKGSWGVSAETRYRKRYKFSGNIYASSLTTKLGDKGLPDYSVTKDFKIRWTHSQDSKANPYQTFSASVNFSTQSYETSNLYSAYNPQLRTQSTKTSSISYNRTFPSIGLSLNTSMNLSQNVRDTTLSVDFPTVSLSLSPVYPFKRKKVAGQQRWYEKIKIQYSGSLTNSIKAKEYEFLDKSLVRDWNNIMTHRIPVDATFQFLKNINITPRFSYSSSWQSYKIHKQYDPDRSAVVAVDTVYGFYRVYKYDFSVSANAKLYGMYEPTDLWRKVFGDKLVAVRHVLTPSVSYSMSPDFSDERYGFYDTYVYTDDKGQVRTAKYSMFRNAPGQGKSQTISMSLGNNLEMKVRSDRDTTGKGTRVISLIDELGGSMSYNFATDHWSDLSTRLRMKFPGTNYTFNFNAVWATYAYEVNDRGDIYVGNRTEYSYGRFGRFQGMSQHWSYTFQNDTFRKWGEKIDKLLHRNQSDEDEEEQDSESTEERRNRPATAAASAPGKKTGAAQVDEDGYVAYSLPWSFSVSYGISMREDNTNKAGFDYDRMRYPWKFVHSMNMSGNMKLTNKWNINFSSGWDFTYHDFTMTTMSVTRDLHCFNMSCSIVLKPYTSYNFTVKANSSMLSDLLKVKKRSGYNSYVNWYDD